MLNEQIKTLRMAQNISQVALAKKLGVSKQSVSNWENNNIQPSIDMLMKIAAFFDVSTDYLLGTEQKQTISTAGLDDVEISHIKLLISDLIKRKAVHNEPPLL